MVYSNVLESLTKENNKYFDEDAWLEDMDDIWWDMSLRQREVANLSIHKKWVVCDGKKYCPFCGKKTIYKKAFNKCKYCEKDIIPEVLFCK